MSLIRYCSCPNCEAIFRLPDEKFNHRAGMVRCGACREVFDSNTNLVEKTVSGFKAVTLEIAPEKVLQSHDQIKNARSDQVVSDKNPGERRGSSGSVLPFRSSANSESVDINSRTDDQPFIHERSQFQVENEIRNPFDDDHREFFNLKIDNYNESDSEPYASNYNDSTDPVIEPLDFDPDESINISLDGVHHEQLKQEQLKQESQDTDWLKRSESRNPDYAFGQLNHDSAGIDMDYTAVFSNDRENDQRSELGANSNLDDTILGRMSKNGVDQYISDRPNPLLSIIWFFVAVGFVFLLGLQVKYFLVDHYAQDETYRKYLAGFCKIAKCELPPRQDPFRFTLTHTKIDLHPTQPSALRITVKLINEANFSQPYPLLQLTLTDRVGRVVGRRTFSPEFYLPVGASNMIGQGELGSILFDLARPHEKAVGFVVDIVTNPVSVSGFVSG